MLIFCADNQELLPFSKLSNLFMKQATSIVTTDIEFSDEEEIKPVIDTNEVILSTPTKIHCDQSVLPNINQLDISTLTNVYNLSSK